MFNEVPSFQMYMVIGITEARIPITYCKMQKLIVDEQP